MKTEFLLGVGALALSAAVAFSASADERAEGARNGATLVAVGAMPEAQRQRLIEQDCAALQKNPNDPALACAAVRCATGISPTWSACPAADERIQTAAAR